MPPRVGVVPDRIDNLADLVVKEVSGSGGYGMLIGPAASEKEIATFRAKLKADPDDFILD